MLIGGDLDLVAYETLGAEPCSLEPSLDALSRTRNWASLNSCRNPTVAGWKMWKGGGV